jgi:hypothetical protein
MCLFEKEEHNTFSQGDTYDSTAGGPVIIQATARSVPAILSWLGEAALLAEHLRKQGILTKM